MKNIKKRLGLKIETLRSLANQQLRQVGGGSTGRFCPETVWPDCRPMTRECEV